MQVFLIVLVFICTTFGLVGFGNTLGSRDSSKYDFYYKLGVIGFIGTIVGFTTLQIILNK